MGTMETRQNVVTEAAAGYVRQLKVEAIMYHKLVWNLKSCDVKEKIFFLGLKGGITLTSTSFEISALFPSKYTRNKTKGTLVHERG